MPLYVLLCPRRLPFLYCLQHVGKHGLHLLLYTLEIEAPDWMLNHDTGHIRYLLFLHH